MPCRVERLALPGIATQAALFPLGMAVSTVVAGALFDALGPPGRSVLLLLLGLSAAASFFALGATTSPFEGAVGALLQP